uniref:Uncharacterized protein n=1 Tax=Rhizophora mucronata TaxID=61149 RepID=A0A2P2NN29_RHIMU
MVGREGSPRFDPKEHWWIPCDHHNQTFQGDELRHNAVATTVVSGCNGFN